MITNKPGALSTLSPIKTELGQDFGIRFFYLVMLEATIEINTLRLHLLTWVDSTLWRRIIVRWCCQASVITRLKGKRDKITVSRLFATKRCWVQIGSIKVTPPFNCSIFIWPRILENTSRGFAAGNRRADGHSRGQKMLSSPRIRTVFTCL